MKYKIIVVFLILIIFVLTGLCVFKVYEKIQIDNRSIIYTTTTNSTTTTTTKGVITVAPTTSTTKKVKTVATTTTTTKGVKYRFEDGE